MNERKEPKEQIRPGKYKATDVAVWFIYRNYRDYKAEQDERMSLLKLMKLLYYAEGCSLAIRNRSLFNEKILAWEHGPVVAEVWRMFPDAFHLQIKKGDLRTVMKKISPEDQDFLEDVYEVFGKYTAIGLRNKTHKETPWLSATNGGTVFNGEVSRQDMKEYFKEHYVEKEDC